MMVVEVPTSSGNPEKIDIDDVAVSTQFHFDTSEQPTYSSANKRDKKKAFCFFLLLFLVLALTASTLYFGITRHKLKEQYASLNIRHYSGSQFRLNLYKPTLELDKVTDSQWQNAAEAISSKCVVETEDDLDLENDGMILEEIENKRIQISWRCLELQIKALKPRRRY